MTDTAEMPAALLDKALDRFAAIKIACLGDVMLDRYLYGRVTRISPEGPIPVLAVERQMTVLGGAANVARNITALGGACRLSGIVGDDDNGRETVALLSSEPRMTATMVTDPARPTTEKARFVAAGQQLLRVDREIIADVSPAIAQQVLTGLETLIRGSDILILSDYAKGTLADAVAKAAIALAKKAGVPVIVDPKARDYSRYAGASVITPNMKEIEDATGIAASSRADAERAGAALLAAVDCDAVLITRAEKGMSVIRRDGNVAHCGATAREVFDVSGAGDTAVAALALSLGAGLNLELAMEVANAAAGISVTKKGTATVSLAELRQALHAAPGRATPNLLGVAEAAAVREQWRSEGLGVAFANGCFDLLHPGHVQLLTHARKLGDRLIVGLNSDASVRRLKGPSRPVQSEADRAGVLLGLQAVDIVVVFDQDTPLELIQALRPDVLVKGADYKVENVVGAGFVQSYGGRVELCSLLSGHATSKTVDRMTRLPR